MVTPAGSWASVCADRAGLEGEVGRWQASWPQSALGREQNGEAAGEAWQGAGCGVRVLGAGTKLDRGLCLTSASW